MISKKVFTRVHLGHGMILAIFGAGVLKDVDSLRRLKFRV
jgi:hypothetical protein